LRYTVEQRLVRTRRRALVWLLASVMAVLGTDDAWPAAHHHVPTHLKYASAHRSKAAEARHHKRDSARAKRFARLRHGKRHHTARTTLPRIARPFERVQRSLPPDLAAVKQALELGQQGKLRETTALMASIGDPVAQKLVEWALLRHAQSEAPFEGLWSRSEQKYAKIPPPLSATTKLDFVFTRPGPLRCLHPSKPGLAEHPVPAPTRGGEAVAGAAPRRIGAPLPCRRIDDLRGPI
jgi:hypothetical protein